MNKAETVLQAKRVIEKNRVYTALAATPEFLEWQEIGPKRSLETLRNRIVDINRADPLWKEQVCEMVIEYQGIVRVFEDNFNIHKRAADTARKIVKEAETKH